MGWEYRRATWDEVCELGPQGWRLVCVPPVQEVKNVLGQMQAGEPLFTMEREVPPGTVRSAPRPPRLSLPLHPGGGTPLVTPG